MKTFLIILGAVVIIVIIYFIYADYKSRKEVEEIKIVTAPIPEGERKSITALDWAKAFIPVVTGTIETIFKKKKKPEEEEEEPVTGPPTYDEWLTQF